MAPDSGQQDDTRPATPSSSGMSDGEDHELANTPCDSRATSPTNETLSHTRSDLGCLQQAMRARLTARRYQLYVPGGCCWDSHWHYNMLLKYLFWSTNWLGQRNGYACISHRLRFLQDPLSSTYSYPSHPWRTSWCRQWLALLEQCHWGLDSLVSCRVLNSC